MKNLSLKEFDKQVKLEARIQKKNKGLIDSNTKKINLIINNADQLNIDTITEWLENMKMLENSSLNCQTLKAYAKFHAGRVSGMQLAIDLLNTIKNNQLKQN